MSTSIELSPNVGKSKENLHTALDDLEVASVNDFECLTLKGNDETVLARADNFLSYTKNELIAIKDAHLSKIRPAALSDRYCNRDGEWDPEQWYYSNESVKRSASPIDKKKSYIFDGIILSPQGRSFAAGCQVTTGKKDEHYGAPKDTIDARKKANSRSQRMGSKRTRQKLTEI
ncbi:eukaryotic translation initiation factor 4E transporter-like [Xenia sp. Carnegie-2017]|uniref:eukaryotic translation initiation factor 4E transporter-like n=1 Tax=Xenia sp. Carnegie-2017 TaxID=2897299 RepID=UPI001F034016|nr:eukaryotic translation initiation factor 4E transporter-like [Xenia sp. Carnegie-2017]